MNEPLGNQERVIDTYRKQAKSYEASVIIRLVDR
jgi:hypothetical protein